MLKRTLLLAAVLSMIAACASGTPIRTTPRCQFDPELMEPAPANLPAAEAGDLATLRVNREDSKEAYKRVFNKHRDLSTEVRNCLVAQDPDGPPKSALDERIERLEGRLK